MIVELTRNHRAYQLVRHVRCASRAASGVVLDLEHGRMFRMNHVASRMLELVKSGLQDPEIVARVTEEFAIGFDTAAHDAREFMETLERLGIIEEPSTGASRSETCA